MNKMFAALRIRNYRLYVAGTLVSSIGTWMQRVAQDWLVLKLTGSAGALGITTGLQFLPILLFSPIAGVLADRLPKRSVLMVTQIAMAATAMTLGLLALTGAVATWHVYALAFVFGTAAAFDTPSRQAFVNEIVGKERLANAIALNSATFHLARMIGPSVAGGIIALLGSGVSATGWVIMVNGATYFAVLVQLKRIRTEELTLAPLIPRAKGQLRAGIAYVRSRPDIMLVMGVVFCAGTFGLNFQMTTALMATEVYDKGAGEYGILGSIVAVGSLLGALIAARRTTARQRLVVVAGVVFGGLTMIAGLMPTYLTFALILPLCGLAALTLLTAANAFVQMAAEPTMRGRVMALYMAVLMGGSAFGAPLLGWISDHAGARWGLIGGGALTAIGAVTAVALSAPHQGVVMTKYFRLPRRHSDVDIGPVVAD